MITFLDHWQTLIGSMIGAASAFLLWVIAESYRQISERKERLISIEKFLGIHTLLVADTYQAIVEFLNGRLTGLINNIEENISTASYHVGITFFPILSLEPLDSNILNLHTGSGYVDTKLLVVIKRSRDFRDMIEDIKRQFETTLSNNRELVLSESNSAQEQKQQFLEQLKQFKLVMNQEILENNIPLCVKELIQAQVSIKELTKKRLWRWKLKFNSSFKYFRDKKQMDLYIKNTHERIDSYLKEKFTNRFKEVNTEFKPRLREQSF